MRTTEFGAAVAAARTQDTTATATADSAEDNRGKENFKCMQTHHKRDKISRKCYGNWICAESHAFYYAH